ncbi:pilin gene inverting-like protein [Streptococcus pneumoniae]|nr:pilin gene inverting-like protein [Streptococcus pneumoniae]
MLYVGIDVAKNKHDVTALNVQGKTVLKPLTFSNNKAGFELLDLSLRQLNQDCLIALEDTGHYAFNLLNFLFVLSRFKRIELVKINHHNC